MIRLPLLLGGVLFASATLTRAHPDDELRGGLNTPSPAAVLLITSPELEKAWEPFAAWKKKLGKPVRIITTEQINDRYDGKDLQEKIRRSVRNHTDNLETRWVILGGDSLPGGKGHVPHRDTVHKTMFGTYKNLPTDIYYVSSKSWDADGDGIFGEWLEDRDSISYPNGEVGMGRIPVRTVEDVKAYTEKVIAFESRYPETDYATTMTYTCTVPQAYAKVRASWDGTVSKALKDGKVQRFFNHETPWDKDKPGDFPLSADNWLELINGKSSGKLHLHGHGLRHCWVLENDEELTFEHVAKLNNKDAYPVITTVSCFTGHYDSPKDPSIAEAMLRQPKGGAVLMVAPVREGKPHFHNPQEDFPLMVKEGKLDGTTRTMTEFWKRGLDPFLTAGEAFMAVKNAMKKDAKKSATFHLCLSELNLLGDPTLHLRSKAPKTPKVQLPETLQPGKLNLIVTTDAPGAVVVLQDSQGIYGVNFADKDGIATFAFGAIADTTVEVTVSGPELNAVTVEIPVLAGIE